MGQQILLTEFYLADYDSSEFQSLLTEQERVWNEEGTSITLSGRFQHADLKNGNGRIYPLEILQREIQNYQQLIKESRAIGELNHPESPTIDLERTSHVVTHLEMRGKEVVGKLRLLNDMPMGTIAKSLYKNKIKFGVSSRALGSVKESKDTIIVQDDLQLICFDLVSDPSTPGAFLHEQKKLFMREQKTKEKRIQEALNEILVFDMGKYGR